MASLDGAVMETEPYAFRNVYIITTYRCNWACRFCLFRHNVEQEAPLETLVRRLRWIVNAERDRKLYIKITGGEPFLRPEALEAIIDTCAAHRDAIYKIGIGTNGTCALGPAFARTPVPTHVFLSRHAIADALPTPAALSAELHLSRVDFRLNCNLIRGGVETAEDIEAYLLARASRDRITHVCFRELSAVNLDAASIYPREVYSYDDYYRAHHVAVEPLLEQLRARPRFTQSRITGNAYDHNVWFWYAHPDGFNMSVKFRSIDEAALLAYNDTHEGVDEYVLHPDGTLTGCWDRDRKIIFKGED